MSSVATWIVTVLLLAGRVFPYNLQSGDNNVATLEEVTNRMVSEGVVARPSSMNKDLTNAVRDATKSSTIQNRNRRDILKSLFNSGKFRNRTLIRDVAGYVNTSIPSVKAFYAEKSRKWDEETNNSGMYKYYNEDASGISESPTVQERGKAGDTCKLSDHCPPMSDCINDVCTCTYYFINKGGNCVESKVGDPCNETRECPKWGQCDLGSCACNATRYDVRDYKCVSKFIGGPCQKSEECSDRGFCNAGRCDCTDGYVQKGLECVTPPSGVEKWVWGVVVAAIGVVVITISAGILIFRKRNREKSSRIFHNEPNASSAVKSNYPPQSYGNTH